MQFCIESFRSSASVVDLTLHLAFSLPGRALPQRRAGSGGSGGGGGAGGGARQPRASAATVAAAGAEREEEDDEYDYITGRDM